MQFTGGYISMFECKTFSFEHKYLSNMKVVENLLMLV
jgi:hypothetical protein